MTKKVAVALAAVLILVLVPNLAMADQVQLGSYNVTLNQSDPGLVLNWSRNLQTPTTTLDLAVGQSVTYNLFKLWTTESYVNVKDDKSPKPISVAFTFLLPTGAAGTVEGSTVGKSLLFGWLQYGQVTWKPLDIAFGDGGKLRIALSDAIFNPGLFGLGSCGASIYARFTLLAPSAPTAVPEPSTLMLLIPGLALFGGLRKRFAR